MPPSNPDGLPYKFREATHIYGPRSVPAQGIVFHMAEGCNVAGYLSGDNVLRGVSSHFTIEADGRIIQMVPLDMVSGSLNPRDVRTSNDSNKMYGRRFTRYYDPDILTGKANHRTISVEMAGRASASWHCTDADGNPLGPYPPGINKAQIQSAVSLVETLRDKYKRPIGVNGHRDFADYKACPGTSSGMKRLFDAVGHGPEKGAAPDPEPEDPELARLRQKYEAVKARLDETEDIIEDLLYPSNRVARRLASYKPMPNEKE